VIATGRAVRLLAKVSAGRLYEHKASGGATCGVTDAAQLMGKLAALIRIGERGDSLAEEMRDDAGIGKHGGPPGE